MAKTYEAVVGLNFTSAKGEVRVEPGERTSEIPTKSTAWLLEQGLICAPGKAPTAEAPAADEQPVEETITEEADA